MRAFVVQGLFAAIVSAPVSALAAAPTLGPRPAEAAAAETETSAKDKDDRKWKVSSPPGQWQWQDTHDEAIAEALPVGKAPRSF
ncbi:MAG: hypothetical protein AAFZ18_14605, partial [Myxococcota bacterium]